MFACILPLISINLNFRGLVPGQDSPEQLMLEEIYCYVNMVVCYFVDQNTFRFTLLTFPLIHIGSYIFMLQAQFKHYFCPYNGKLMDGDLFGSIFMRITLFVTMTLLLVGHTYLEQKDIILYIVKNHLKKR